MQERKRFIEDWLAGGGSNIAGLCRTYQISRKTGYKWIERFRQGGLSALEDRSHAALRQPGRMPESVERRIVAARREHPSWGPKKLRAWLEAREPGSSWPAASTIGEALRRAGLVSPRRKVRRVGAGSGRLQDPQRANEVWSIDYKGQFRTGDGQWCYPLTVVDGYSRYLLACVGHRQPSGAAARASLEELFGERGLPERMRSDNGTPFASAGAGRLSQLSAWWLKLGIEVERIAPGKPQQNGRHERLHRTLKAQTARPPAADRQQQQERFDRFREEYNEERPHEALGQRPPGSVYERSGRSCPEELADPDYPGHWERRRVKKDGYVRFQGRAHFLSEALAKQLTGWVEVDEGAWEVWFGPVELALFDASQAKLRPLGAKTAGRRS